ncbi:stage II sporulation protein AA (anti-sigma F factor antagonist) [Orenia metallireducens]|jgi:anti-anti-sigma factor|uniref:Stage II sporulation protein AA (Anti-sigma F factor antagonist) n=1 Tax=Orenia metallireducens TaxID=1413210 RepID=A0A285IDM7_9FIRM|nr:STAS domain-containing protein [Orenia metallireducens]PRX19663.1 stage II sporulation protein AA (anti-sigma F factor antagonist) [Orenia metallireducens]SNY46070.1 stage II sporulation protein AA (anti-sigma F factor antagonist) [Orenia metallireducens]
MNIEIEKREDIAIINMHGELDMSTVDDLVAKTKELTTSYSNIIFNFAGIEFVDSTGIGNIIKIFKDNNSDNYLITNLSSDVEEIFYILNLKELLGEKRFTKSLEEALNLLQDKQEDN